MQSPKPCLPQTPPAAARAQRAKRAGRESKPQSGAPKSLRRQRRARSAKNGEPPIFLFGSSLRNFFWNFRRHFVVKSGDSDRNACFESFPAAREGQGNDNGRT